MKRIIFSILFSGLIIPTFAQNEGRIGIFTGVSKTSLHNSDDESFGDLLPTFKPSFGLEAGYTFTLFHSLPLGFSFQFSKNYQGQNYRGNYMDSTSYYAYSRLQYARLGFALNSGTNLRRQVALIISAGANIGFLTSYQDRYELIRYNNERLIFDVRNTEVDQYDTSKIHGTLTSPMYNKTDLNIFATIGASVLLSKSLVLGIYGRLDYGLSDVNNLNKINVNFETDPVSSINYKPFNTKIKYHGPTSDLITHTATTNLGMGVYMSLKYRLYNREKVKFYYNESEKLN